MKFIDHKLRNDNGAAMPIGHTSMVVDDLPGELGRVGIGYRLSANLQDIEEIPQLTRVSVTLIVADNVKNLFKVYTAYPTA